MQGKYKTALAIACRCGGGRFHRTAYDLGKPEVVKALLQAGADPAGLKAVISEMNVPVLKAALGALGLAKGGARKVLYTRLHDALAPAGVVFAARAAAVAAATTATPASTIAAAAAAAVRRQKSTVKEQEAAKAAACEIKEAEEKEKALEQRYAEAKGRDEERLWIWELPSPPGSLQHVRWCDMGARMLK